jgi:hypothetical protein
LRDGEGFNRHYNSLIVSLIVGSYDLQQFDITLPGASSREVLEEAMRQKPGMITIATSGPRTDADGQCEFRYQPQGWGQAYRFIAPLVWRGSLAALPFAARSRWLRSGAGNP